MLDGLLGAASAIGWVTLCRRKRPTAPVPAPIAASTKTVLNRPVLTLACSFFSYSYPLFFFLSWFPGYLTLGLHLELRQASLIDLIPWSCGAVGLLAGGLLSDRLLRLYQSVAARRLVIVIVTSLGANAAAVLVGGLAQQAALAVGGMAVEVFFFYLSG